MWGGQSDVDSDDWESGGEGVDQIPVTDKDWLKQASHSLHRLGEVKPSVYNISLFDPVNWKTARSKVRGNRSAAESGAHHKGAIQNGVGPLRQSNKTAWGSSNSLLDLLNQNGVRQRPQSAKLTSAGRPPSGKRSRPQSAQLGSQATVNSSKPLGIAILGSPFDSSPPTPLQKVSQRATQPGWVSVPKRGNESSKPRRNTSPVSAPPCSPRGDNQEDETTDGFSDVSSVKALSTPVVERIHFSIPTTDEVDDNADISTERLIEKAMNRRSYRQHQHLDNTLLGDDSRESGRPCTESVPSRMPHDSSARNCSYKLADTAERTRNSQRHIRFVDDVQVTDDHSCIKEVDEERKSRETTSMKKPTCRRYGDHDSSGQTVIGKDRREMSDSRTTALNMLNGSSNLEISNSCSSATTTDKLQNSSGGGKEVSLVTLTYGNDIDKLISEALNSSQEIETMMSTLAVSENKAHGLHGTARSSSHQSKQRKDLNIVHWSSPSNHGTVSESKINQSHKGKVLLGNHNDDSQSMPDYTSDQLQQGTLNVDCDINQSHEGMVEKCRDNNQTKQGTVLCSSREKNYYELLKSVCLKSGKQKLVEPETEGEDESVEKMKIIGVGTVSSTSHLTHQLNSQNHNNRDTHSARHSLLRRPRTKSAPVSRPLRRSFPLRSEVVTPTVKRVTPSLPAPVDQSGADGAADGVESADPCPEAEGQPTQMTPPQVDTDPSPSLSQRSEVSPNRQRHFTETVSQKSQAAKPVRPHTTDHMSADQGDTTTTYKRSHVWGETPSKPEVKNLMKKVSASMSNNKGHYSAYSRSFSADPVKKVPPKPEKITAGFNLVTKKPEHFTIETEEVKECRRLQDKLGENGINVNLQTLKRALLPPDGSTYYYEMSSVDELPKCNSEGLLSHPKVWLREEHHQLLEAKKALARANERMRLQKEEEARAEDAPDKRKTKASKKGKKSSRNMPRKVKRSKSVT